MMEKGNSRKRDVSRERRRRRRPIPPIFLAMAISSFVLTIVLGLIVNNFVFTKEEKVKTSETVTLSEQKQSEDKETVKNNKETSPSAEKENDHSTKQRDGKEEKKAVEKTEPSTKKEKGKKAANFFDKGDNVVEDLVSRMTLEEKIGQMMVVGFQSSQADNHIKTMIEDYHVGGVILYDRNMNTPSQVAALNNSLQDLAAKSKLSIPLLMSVDQEGGSIVRMKDHVSHIPSQQALGQKGGPQLVYNTAVKTGDELKSMGFHVNFAPVLDLSDEDSRSFGSDPSKATSFGGQVVSGLIESGVTPTLKHFPGNGRSSIDPHVETSSVKADQWDLENKDIYPFTQLIKTKDNSDFFVMVTHIKYPAYDKENPASISPVIIEDLLREKLSFKGLVVTDDLEMGAVNKYFTYEDLGYKAVESGNDLLLVCHTLANQKKVFNGIRDAVKSGKLPESRVDEAVKRILAYKLAHIQSVKVNPEYAAKNVGKS